MLLDRIEDEDVLAVALLSLSTISRLPVDYEVVRRSYWFELPRGCCRIVQKWFLVVWKDDC
jgi:hypothetical protein